MNCYHLIAVGTCWALTRESDSATLREYTTRWQAIDDCREILSGELCSLLIHGTDGSVQAVRTYSGDHSRPAVHGKVRSAFKPGKLSPVSRPHREVAARVRPRPFLSPADRALRAQRIGTAILSKRTRLGLSRTALGSLLGVSAWSIKEWEKGRSFPGKFSKQVAEWLGPEGEAVFSTGAESAPAVYGPGGEELQTPPELPGEALAEVA
jgi:hypothetical protein